jgi:hypothetical protein
MMVLACMHQHSMVFGGTQAKLRMNMRRGTTKAVCGVQTLSSMPDRTAVPAETLGLGSEFPAEVLPTSPSTSPDKSAIIARIAKAKQYSKGLPSQTRQLSTESLVPSPVPSQPPDWGAVASFLDSGGKRSEVSDTVKGRAPDGSDVADGDGVAIAAELARAARFEAAKDKMSDELSPLDTDNTSYVSMIMSATQVWMLLSLLLLLF